MIPKEITTYDIVDKIPDDVEIAHHYNYLICLRCRDH